MIIFSMLMLAGIALGLAVSPLVRPPLEAGPARYYGEDEVQVLRRKKEIVYGNIKDLDFEYKMGKLGDDDYQRLRNELKLEAVLLMESMERAKKGHSVDDALESEIQTRRQRRKAGATGPGLSSPEVQGDEEFRCPGCQAAIPRRSKFCPECGFRVAVQ